ncbi:MAG: hypothetical protein GY758_20255 [Fuerstiella sp.]|nr:hypothetical protein [Fuerstiella sp.]MCP4511940.1 hypothetical protein [Fuerstiella sp.]
MNICTPFILLVGFMFSATVSLQSFTLACGRKDLCSMEVSLLSQVNIVYDIK